MARFRRGRWVLAALGAVLFVVMLVLGPWSGPDDPQDRNPFVGRELYVRPDAAVVAAASGATATDGAVLERMARVPAAIWLTPEAHGVERVGSFVRSQVELADLLDQTLVLVVYGIPDRDCTGEESAGGLPADAYDDWVGRIADALAGDVAVIVEPDALAGAVDCDDPELRTALIADAVDRLADDAAVYLDAGHSDWRSPDDMADLLRDAGVERARGFSVNVSGYQPDADELAYAERIRTALPSAHFVVDSSRNGAGATGDWCNPPGRALGALPAAVDDDSALDARLWVKPPGESDGRCHGGPPAGEFWPDRAVELARAAGW